MRRSCSRGRLFSAARIAVFAAWGSAWVGPGSIARAEEKPDLTFSAKEVEGDGKMRELVLRGDVVVTYERFRLTSPELALRRTPRGIEVRGPGEVVFCPCANPPVSVGFEGGLVGPPADLILKRPSLRIAGTEVLVLPWFWLRSPSRAGIVPPNVAWRGGDGLLVGEGIHLPWRAGASDELDELDFMASAYLKGGLELALKFRTARSTERVRWDHLRTDLFAIDANGSALQPNDGAVAWDIDAVRGPRARSAATTLDEAARAYDRAAGEAMFRPAPSVIVSAGIRAVGARGSTGPSERPVWGPRAAFGLGGAVGSIGAWDGLATLSALHDGGAPPTAIARAEAGLDLTARPAIFVTTLSLREATTAADSDTVSALDAVGTARVDISAPLARVYDGDPSPIVHVIEPRIEGALVAARTSGAYWSQTARPVALGSGQVAVASAGFRTAWGRLLGDSGGALEADVGGVAPLVSGAPIDPEPVGRVRSAWSSRFVGWGADAAGRLRGPRGRVLAGKIRVGEQQGWHVALRSAGRVGIEPIAARALSGTNAEEPSGGWLASEGWSAGAEARAELTRSVGVTLSADEDLTSRTLLGVRGTIGYAHPCRCIAIDAFAGKRLGRDGIDVWVSIDLAPR